MKLSMALSALFVVAATSLMACGPAATPVTPAPLSAEDAPSVKQNLLGHWKCTDTKVGDGEKRSQPADVQMTFKPDGTYHHYIHFGFAGIDKDYGYKLDGKNIVTDSPHGTYRIDNVTASSLELFHYEGSTTWYFVR